MSFPTSVYKLAQTGFGTEDVLKFCKAAVEEGQAEKWRAAGTNHEAWNRKAAMYYGRERIDSNPHRKRARENRVWRAQETQRYVLVDHMPAPEFLPRDPEVDQMDSDALNDVLTFNRDVSNYRKVYHDFVNNLLIFGTGIRKIFWNPEEFGGKGMAWYAAPDPRSIFVSPGTTCFDDAAYVIQVGMIDYDKALFQHPDKEDELMSMVEGDQKSVARKMSSFFQGLFIGPGNTTQTGGADAQKNMERMSTRAIEEAEFYVRIGSQIRMFKILGGSLVVYNDWLPYEHGRMPYVATQARHFPDRLWGEHDITDSVEALQQELNRLAEKRNAYIETSHFPVKVLLKGGGISPDQLESRPNRVVMASSLEAANIAAGAWIVPPQTGRTAQGRRQEIFDEIDQEIGAFTLSSDVIQRNLQPTTVMQYREAGEAPVRMKLEYMRTGDTELSFQAVALMKQYFPTDIITARVGQNGEMQRRVVSIEQFRGMSEIDKTRFDVRTGVPSEVPLSNAMRYQQVMEVAKSLPPDLPEVTEAILNASNFPGKDRIIQALRDRAAQAQALAEAQAGMQGGVPSGATPNLDSTDPDEVEAALMQSLQGQAVDTFGQLQKASQDVAGNQPLPNA